MKNEVIIPTKSTEETMAFGEFLGKLKEEGLFIALDGDLGAGKTHFVQGFAKGMGILDPITSPTFNIMNYYDGDLVFKHFDFYRLNDVEELYVIGWDEYGEGGVIVCEWASLFPEVIPPTAISISIEITGETERNLRISFGDEAPENLQKEIVKYAASH